MSSGVDLAERLSSPSDYDAPAPVQSEEMLTETAPAPAGRTLAQTAAEALAEPTTPSMLGTWGADDLGDDFADLFVTD